MVFDTVAFGRLMSLDGITQVTMADEYVYHEMLSHLPILAHGNVKDVLIVGGGDGGLAEEVLKHSTVERMVMVEIDAGVIDFARAHWQSLNRGCFDDKRFKLVSPTARTTPRSHGEIRIISSTHRSHWAGRGVVHQQFLCRLQADAQAGWDPAHPERRAVLSVAMN